MTQAKVNIQELILKCAEEKGREGVKLDRGIDHFLHVIPQFKNLIGKILIIFLVYVNLFENSGKEAFLKRYYDFWLHTREEVTVEIGDTGIKEKVIIRGLDTYGYLEVRSKQTGKVFSVHDNGNTFDMMKGLIRPKNR
uniref:Uncharacterized protein n=1 Tax=Panagrolaimus sp. JU765 TaxID=591449 RepID=A0AC34RBT3_9BILA